MKGAKAKGAASKVSKEALKAVEDRKVGKRKAATKADKGGKKQVKKVSVAKKNPNKPKRSPSAFFVFLEEFRETFKKENPNVKAVSAVGKAGGAEWKSMSSAEKAFYEAKAAKRKTEYAAKRKAEYEKLMNAYNKKQESMADDGDEESDRSNSEVNNDDEDSEQEEDDDED